MTISSATWPTIVACFLVAIVGWMILVVTKPARERAELERQADELDEYSRQFRNDHPY